MKKLEMNNVAPQEIANVNKKFSVSPGNMRYEILEKRKADSPYAAIGNAVAVPLCLGYDLAQAFKAAALPKELPTPVRKEQKQR